MNKRLRKKNNAKLITQFTNEELFTELIKRIPKIQRTCMFVSAGDNYEKHSRDYKLHNANGTLVIKSEQIQGDGYKYHGM